MTPSSLVNISFSCSSHSIVTWHTQQRQHIIHHQNETSCNLRLRLRTPRKLFCTPPFASQRKSPHTRDVQKLFIMQNLLPSSSISSSSLISLPCRHQVLSEAISPSLFLKKEGLASEKGGKLGFDAELRISGDDTGQHNTTLRQQPSTLSSTTTTPLSSTNNEDRNDNIRCIPRYSERRWRRLVGSSYSTSRSSSLRRWYESGRWYHWRWKSWVGGRRRRHIRWQYLKLHRYLG